MKFCKFSARYVQPEVDIHNEMKIKYKSKRQRENREIFRWFSFRHLRPPLGRAQKATSSSYSLLKFIIQNTHIYKGIEVDKAKDR